MDMNKNSILIKLDLEFKIISTSPDICIKLDDTVIMQGPQSLPVNIKIIDQIYPGPHRLTIDFFNKNYNECSHNADMAVIINRVQFQHIDYDFKIYSDYYPDYPNHWIDQHPESKEKIHANYLGWNGQWALDFETPIYALIHRRLNLGWLIK